MKALVAGIASLAVSGCAMSSAGLADASVDTTMVSETKSPKDIAICVAESLNGGPTLRNDGDHYWVTRANGYGIPTTRWDFRPRPGGGTNIELRTTVPINSGDEKVRACL